MMQPYRLLGHVDKSMIVVEQRPPKYGRLPGKPVPPPHICLLPKPSWFHSVLRLFNLNSGYPFFDGDLWRCECGKVYRHLKWDWQKQSGRSGCMPCNHECSTFCRWWVASSIEEWKELGGEE